MLDHFSKPLAKKATASTIDTSPKKVYNLFKQLCCFQNVHLASTKNSEKVIKIIVTLKILSTMKKRISNFKICVTDLF